jgi:hypothetical protein
MQEELKAFSTALKKEGINRIKRVSSIGTRAKRGSLLLLLLNKLGVGLLLGIGIIVGLRY